MLHGCAVLAGMRPALSEGPKTMTHTESWPAFIVRVLRDVHQELEEAPVTHSYESRDLFFASIVDKFAGELQIGRRITDNRETVQETQFDETMFRRLIYAEVPRGRHRGPG